MCNFFSFVSNGKGKYFYFDWAQRTDKNIKIDSFDSHSEICAHYRVDCDKVNKYEYNPLTKVFKIDQINLKKDDAEYAELWVKKLDFKTIIEPLVIKKIINPLIDKRKLKVTEKDIARLKEWVSVLYSIRDSVCDSVCDSVRDLVGALVRDLVRDSVGGSVEDSVWASMWDSVIDLVGDSVEDSVWASMWDSVRDSVGDSVWAYISSFFNIQYKYDFSNCVKLWESGLVPSFDGKIWRLHGYKGKILYEMEKGE
jgi:hypothetical protein